MGRKFSHDEIKNYMSCQLNLEELLKDDSSLLSLYEGKIDELQNLPLDIANLALSSSTQIGKYKDVKTEEKIREAKKFALSAKLDKLVK